MQRGTEAFPRKQERDKSNRIKNRSGGGGIERDGHSDLTGARRGRLGGVPLSEPVVVDADRLELDATSTTPSSSPSGSPASSSSPSSCSWPIASSASATGQGNAAALRAGEQAARIVAHGRDRGRRRGHAGAGPVRLAPVRHRPGGRDRDRGRRPAMAVELTACRARTAGSAPPTPATSAPTIRSGVNPNDPNGQDDVVIDGDDLHLPIGKPVKVLLRSIDVLHDFYVPEFRAKMDMIPGLGHLFLVHPDPDRHLRGPVRRALRRRPPGDARQGRRRGARAITRPGSSSSRPSPQLSARRSWQGEQNPRREVRTTAPAGRAAGELREPARRRQMRMIGGIR